MGLGKTSIATLILALGALPCIAQDASLQTTEALLEPELASNALDTGMPKFKGFIATEVTFRTDVHHPLDPQIALEAMFYMTKLAASDDRRIELTPELSSEQMHPTEALSFADVYTSSEDPAGEFRLFVNFDAGDGETLTGITGQLAEFLNDIPLGPHGQVRIVGKHYLASCGEITPINAHVGN